MANRSGASNAAAFRATKTATKQPAARPQGGFAQVSGGFSKATPPNPYAAPKPSAGMARAPQKSLPTKTKVTAAVKVAQGVKKPPKGAKYL